MTTLANKRLSYASLLAPAILVYAAVIIFPIVFTVGFSFTEWTGFGTPEWIGLSNFTKMFQDPVFQHGLRNNILVVAISVFGQIPLGFVLAYILYRRMVHAGRFFEVTVFLPITISPVVVGILWGQIFSPQGVVTKLIRVIQDDPRYVFQVFEDKMLAIVPILFVILWLFTGLYMVIFIANLQQVDPEVLESATIDGATEGQILTRIIMPAMTTILFTTAVFAITGSFKSFALIWAMTNGGPAHYTEVISIHMYLNTFRYYNYGYGAAVSVIIILFSVVLVLLAQGIHGYFRRKYD